MEIQAVTQEIEDLAVAMEKMLKEEEIAFCKLLAKRRELKSFVFEIPPAAQWKYDYIRVSYGENKKGYKTQTNTPGVATARFCKVDHSYEDKVVFQYGATDSFLSKQIGYKQLREKMGGLAAVLAAIKQSLAKANEIMKAGREEAMQEIKTMSDADQQLRQT